MIPFETMIFRPRPHGSLSREAGEILRSLEARLRVSDRGGSDVLALTFFVDATDAAGYELRQDELLAVMREFFAGARPPVSVVAQPPEGRGRVALEATVLLAPATDLRVRRKSFRGARYTLVTGGDVRQIHAAGIASHAADVSTAARARRAFATMETILRREGLNFDHVVRQWNYLEGMLDIRADGKGGHQGYQDFNDVRTRAYGDAGFPAGYPAATGIGQAAGGVLIEFLAVQAPAEVRVVPLSNPRQTDAHHYSSDMLVGESKRSLSTPKFERAKLVARGDTEVTFVSGTAAIVGERSVAPGDVAAQTETTIANMTAVLGGRRLTHLRAYVKHDRDIPVVRRVCERAFGAIPALYVRADVCRGELLVELEGVAR